MGMRTYLPVGVLLAVLLALLHPVLATLWQ
jgi:hypothetical protein